MGIKVNQFDSTGKLVACYDSYSEAAKVLGCNESTIRKATKKLDHRNAINKHWQTDRKFPYYNRVFGKFYFLNDDDGGVVPQMGGMYEIGKPSNLTTSKLKENLIEVEGEIRNLRVSNSNSINDPIVIPCDEYFTVKPSKITKEFLYNQPEVLEIVDNKPRILLLDIETSLLLANVFQKQVWKARIGSNLIVSDYYMLTWSAKWLGEDEIYSDRLTVEEVLNEDDKRITINLWDMLDQAEIVIGHNSDSFDIPNIYTRCVYHELPPPSPFRQVDTLKIAQKYFGFTHNGLDALCKFFKMPGKIHTNVELWKSCIRGDEKALVEMETYNRQDVKALEDVFYKLRPYAKNLPNLNMYQDSSTITCPSCGSIHMEIEKDKYFYTNATKFQVYRCNGCGATSRSRKGLKISERFVSPIPR